MRTLAALVIGVLIGTTVSGSLFDLLRQDVTAKVIVRNELGGQRVDRTLKGNRLNLPVGEATKGGARSPLKVPTKILIGCEPAISMLSPVTGQAARCAT
jgi:hypothetical protein